VSIIQFLPHVNMFIARHVLGFDPKTGLALFKGWINYIKFEVGWWV